MLTIPRAIPLAAAAGLAVIYFTLLWRLGDTAHWGMSAIFGLAILSLLWDKRPKIFKGEAAAVGLGALIIAAYLGVSPLLSDSETFIRLMPPIFGVGVALIAAGFQGMVTYRQELLLLFFLSVPRVIFSLIQDISPVTARFSAFLLWYVGFDPRVNGVYLTVKERAIQVWEGCSGAESICYMVGIAVVCLTLYPVKNRLFQFCAVVAAALLGFVINAIRVSLLAVLVTQDNLDAFTYWHEGDGSLIFGTASVALFGALYWFVSTQFIGKQSAGLTSSK